MTTILILTGAFLIFLGVLIKHGRMYDLISGYSSMPSEKRIKFDTKGFATLLRNCLVLMGLLIIIGHLFFKWIEWYKASAFIVFFTVLPILFYLIVVGEQFNGDYPVEKARKDKKIIFSIYGLFLAIVIVFLLYGYQNTKVNFQNEKFEIVGLNGFEIKYEYIDKVELLTTIPKIKLKTDGYNLGKTLKGNFKLEEVGNCKLFLKSMKAPFIKIVYNDTWIVFLNFNDSEETKNVFTELSNKLEN